MEIEGDYSRDGYALARGLLPPEVSLAFLNQFKIDIDRTGIGLETMLVSSKMLKKEAIEIHSSWYAPMQMLLWGLTPTIARIAGADLLPTYCYLRVYEADDICRVHRDREACEHSVSLFLGSSDGIDWPLEIATEPSASYAYVDDFGDQSSRAFAMQPGDALIYDGVNLRHGRVAPNPNRWSAHLFLHWVARDGEHMDQLFDGHSELQAPFALELAPVPKR